MGFSKLQLFFHFTLCAHLGIWGNTKDQLYFLSEVCMIYCNILTRLKQLSIRELIFWLRAEIMPCTCRNCHFAPTCPIGGQTNYDNDMVQNATDSTEGGLSQFENLTESGIVTCISETFKVLCNIICMHTGIFRY